MIPNGNKIMTNLPSAPPPLSPSAAEVGQLVRDARKAQKMTQDQLAALTGTGRRVISEIENGKESVQIGKLLLILAALGIGLAFMQKWRK